ncbi:hypothetical protein GCM10010517_40910 [Streptosporangium fragile]|uniref:DUF6259 domain-containing protein n=1 Tax=Streptosporangium fragile TaxID=46186 RepID=A0ABN3W068_9ACTN
MKKQLVIRDDRAEVTFDAVSGGITGVRDIELGAWIGGDSRPSLFVFEIPRHGDRTVVATTDAQTLASASAHEDGRSISLAWDGLVTSTGEYLEGRVEVGAALDGAGHLELTLDAVPGEVTVEAVRFPSLRGIRPAAGDSLDLVKSDYTQGSRVELLPSFDSNAPYWGTMVPDHASGNLRPEVVCNPTAPFVVLAGETGGITVMPSSPTLEFVGWRFSLEPGYLDSLTKLTEGPDGGSSITLDAIQMPVRTGERLRTLPITVALYRGAWEQGLVPYRATQRESRIPAAGWLREPRTWLQVQLMSTENEPRYDFDELVSIIEECAARGIGAIQIVGWNEGGQDGLVPVHRPAGKLGGEPGLRRALERARELDVKAVLYVKYQWVERPGRYWDDFAADVCLDENGQPYAQPGPVYHTARKRYGMSTPWYVPLCFASEALRGTFAREVAEMAGWGAAGVLADESLYHGRALLCFAPGHGHPPGASAYLWDGAFVEDLRGAAGAVAEDFVIAGEGCYDGQFEHYDLSYFRSSSERHIPLGRRLRSDVRMVTALVGFDDRNMANQCLLYGYAMSLEPFNFKGRPSDMPKTVAYANAVDDLRRRLAPWLWNGTFLGSEGVTVAGEDPGARPPQVAVWESGTRPGSRCVVVANYDDDARTFRVTFDAPWRPVVLGVGAESPSPLAEGRLELAPRSAAVLIDADDL